MSKPTGVNHSTLSWVKKELDETLKQAAEALEAHSQDHSDTTQLRFCGTHLHQVHGILQMLELFGAAMAVEEMEQVVEALADGQVSNRDDAHEVLMRAILQLSDYLERIQGGLQDIPILILPLLNDLRAARGANLLTENALFTPDLELASAAPRRARLGRQPLDQVARKARHRYQLGLLGFLRDQAVKKSLSQMLEVLDELDDASGDDQTGTVWWVSGGLVEALIHEALERSTAVKSLLGQVDRQIKRVLDHGEEAFAISPPRELLKNLLYYVARSQPVGERVPAIQTQYNLKDLLLDESQLQHAREGMSGPNTEILQTVADAIKEDLTGVKEILDLFVRGGSRDLARLGSIADVLRRIADTLGVLGLGVPRGVLKEQSRLITDIQEGKAEASEAKLMEVAEALLYVESALDGLIKRSPGDQTDWLFTEETGGAEDRERSEKELFELEYRAVYGSAINEAVAEVGRIKDTIVKFMESGNVEDLATLDQRFAGVCGALRVLEMGRAAELLQAAGRYVEERILPGQAHPDDASMDALADTITSIEYYLEAVTEGRAAPETILDVAATGLDRLGFGTAAASDPAAAAPTADLATPAQESQAEAPQADQPLSLEDLELTDEFDVDSAPQAPVEPEPVVEAAPVVAEAPAAPRKTGRINYDVPLLNTELDADILEIFVEEAGEVLETLSVEFPLWRDNPDNTDALATCRRMFHTLKGSGRLAGALLLGELAWTQENLLNRIMEQAIQPSPELHRVIQRALDAMPELVANIQDGPAPTTDIHAIMREAERLADPSAAPVEQPVAAAAAPDQPAESVEAAEAPADIETVELDESLEILELEPEAEQPAKSIEALELDPVGEPSDESVDVSELELSSEPESFEALELDSEGEAEATALEALELESGDEPEIEIENLEALELGPDSDDPLEIGEALTLSEDLDAAPLEALEAAPVVDESVELEPLADAPEADPEPVTDESAPVLEDDAPAADATDLEVDPSAAEEGGMDPVLFDIFNREAEDHLSVVAEFVAEGRNAGGSCRVSEPLVRALHTLSGSARMADVDPIARLGRKLEAYAEEHLAEERGFVADDLALLEQGASLIRALIAELPKATPNFPDIAPLLTAVDEARVLKARTAGAEAQAPAPAAAQTTPAFAGLDVDTDLVDLFLEEAQDILQFIEETVQRWEEEPDRGNAIAELHRSLHTLKGGARLAGFQGIGALCHVLEGISGDVADHKVPADDDFFNLLHGALDQLADMVEAAKSGIKAEMPQEILQQIAALRGGEGLPEVVPTLPDLGADTELMEVFLEEAAEILESTEATLHTWQEDPDNRELVTEIQRALHTLKGGARMAGFQPIANLSHSLETLLVKLVNEGDSPTPALFDLLERVHDRLFSMREKAVEQERLVEATDLLQAIEAFSHGPAAAPAPAAPAVVAESAPAEQPRPVAEAAPAAAPDVVEIRDDRAQHDVVRVRADLLDNLVNYAGEVSIYRARLDQQVGAMRFNLTEFDQTVARLREQLRTMEIETEAQMLYRFEREQEVAGVDTNEDFDPLEFDRFSRMQELSRALSESVNDLVSIQGLLDNLARDSETLLLQQSRVNTELQDGLMRTRMVPFANLVPRMRRIVRQTCHELNKQAQFKVLGAQGEMDRTVLERVIPPLEHMLRNAIAHGIEAPADRAKAGKAAEGTVTVSLSREGADVVIRVADDGGGMKLEAIRKKALQLGLMTEGAPLTDREVMQFVLEAGFSTAESVSQIAGRGVGMDVVASEIKQLGGTLEIDSVPGQGTTFIVRLPFTLAINQALLCQAAEEAYAIPLTSIEGVVRMTHEELEHCFQNPHQAYYDYAGSRYEVKSLAHLLGTGEPALPGPGKRLPIVLVQTGDHRLAIQVDALLGNREIVVKSVGPQVSSVPGIYGATILADGRVVLILDLSTLVRLGVSTQVGVDADGQVVAIEDDKGPAKPVIMVVDDSITMRKVATRLLERNGYEVVTAKDGVDAVARLQEVLPDGMLLDIEMPRMDGYELATHMRNDARLKGVPIIMITSRTGEKHRQRAFEIGVNRYLGKPYQESDLLENLTELLEERRGRD